MSLASFNDHVQQCMANGGGAGMPTASPAKQLSFSASSSSSPSATASPAVLQAAIQSLQQQLSGQSADVLRELAPSLHGLQRQIHSTLIPIATMHGVVNVASNAAAAQPATAAQQAASHVLTSRSTSSGSSSALSAASPPSPLSANVHPSTIRVSFSPNSNSGDAAAASSSSSSSYAPARPASSSSSNDTQPTQMQHVFTELDSVMDHEQAAVNPPRSEADDLAAAIAASTAPAAAAASSSSSASAFAMPADDVMSDEEMIRRLQEEDERLVANERKRRREEEEAAFQKFLQSEGTCSKCGNVPQLQQELIPMSDDKQRKQKPAQSCEHKMCHSCLKQYLSGVIAASASPAAPLTTESDLMCPMSGCCTPIAQWQMKRVLSPSEFERLLSITFQNTIKKSAASGVGGSRLVRCPKADCGLAFEAVEGRVDPNASRAGAQAELGLDGQPISAVALVHRAKNRFRCNTCTTVFCGGCSVTPYHEGFTCEQFTAYRAAKKCRFCEVGLTAANTAKI